MKSLHTAVETDAPAERVWQVVGDFARYSDWNPFIVRAAAAHGCGAPLSQIVWRCPRLESAPRRRFQSGMTAATRRQNRGPWFGSCRWASSCTTT